jgi:dsDNA-specific endonuclease/ATPase MutS2
MTLKSLLRSVAELVKGRGKQDAPNPTDAADSEDATNIFDPDSLEDTVVIEFRDVLDLHSIPPALVKKVVEGYLAEAHDRGVKWVRIIHGKGIGVQREIVRSILAKTDFVTDFRDAPIEAGGWGATVVTLKQ